MSKLINFNVIEWFKFGVITSLVLILIVGVISGFFSFPLYSLIIGGLLTVVGRAAYNKFKPPIINDKYVASYFLGGVIFTLLLYTGVFSYGVYMEFGDVNTPRVIGKLLFGIPLYAILCYVLVWVSKKIYKKIKWRLPK